MAITKFQSTDQELNRFQDLVVPEVNKLLDTAIVKGKLVEGLAITTSAQTFEHSLGRTPKGYLIVSRSANAVVYNPAAATDRYLTLQGSAAVTITIWVF